MNFDWSRWLEVADKLCVDGDGEVPADPQLAEAAWRTAVNRAYYAIFNMTSVTYVEYWRTQVPEYEGMGVHGALIRSLKAKEPYVSDAVARAAVARIIKDLERLRKYRREADYEASVRNPKSMASRALKYARNISTELGSLSRTP